jgi:hypothetical protein
MPVLPMKSHPATLDQPLADAYHVADVAEHILAGLQWVEVVPIAVELRGGDPVIIERLRA